ncbi:MAG TPA: hypothetical protein VFN49_07685 [Candidatus Aquilonibacter sp.]|nr:hypothetical protein [Candidatus Aquilonibacter sp.]
MAIMTDSLATGRSVPTPRSYSASLDIDSPVEDAFALLCAVEKWPVWLSCIRSANAVEPAAPLALGSEVLIRSTLPGDEEQLYEVDQFIANYHLSLVGAYSVRRRIDFRIERKTSRARIHVKLTYPAYGGRVGSLVDSWRNGRKLERILDDALVHFKGLVEYRTSDAALGDF